MVRRKEVIFIQKGVKYSNKDIAKQILSSKFDYAMYHTRITSAGSIKDSNCHPFFNQDGTLVLEQNGTEGSFARIARSLDMTDCELIFNMLNSLNISPEVLSTLTANYMGFKDGVPFVVCNNTLEYIQTKHDLVIASSLPSELSKLSKTLDTGAYFDINKLKEKKVFHYEPKYGSYTPGVYSNKTPQEPEAHVIPTSVTIHNPTVDKGYINDMKIMSGEENGDAYWEDFFAQYGL